MDAANLEMIWLELQEEAQASDLSTSRVYRALGRNAIGIRASYVPANSQCELLVEVPISWELEGTWPEWHGLQFSVIRESIPPRPAHQLSLALQDDTSREVFIHFTSHLVKAMEGIPDAPARVSILADCIGIWNQFFKRSGLSGLSESAQRGVLAELLWLDRILDLGVEPSAAVESWKGCRRGYHDFDLGGNLVEVKSTMGKEPRRVFVNNERQLDDRGLLSLHLYVVTFQPSQGAPTLPQVVGDLRSRFEDSTVNVRQQFERCLVGAGFLDCHSSKYRSGYAIRSEECFEVREGFPRIVDVPEGVGNLKYSIVVGACGEFRVSSDDVLARVKRVDR